MLVLFYISPSCQEQPLEENPECKQWTLVHSWHCCENQTFKTFPRTIYTCAQFATAV